MKILCNFTPCGPSYVRSGWGRVFRALGHEFHFWNPEQKPAFDVFSEVEPDLYIGTSYETDRAVVKNIVKRPEMRVILYASAWGPYLKDVDLQKYPLVVTSEQEKATIEKLKKETGRPDFVFIHAHDRWLEGTMSGWSEIGVRYAGIMNAADAFVYLNGRFRQELACDVGFVGGYWPYKARNIDRYLLPLCHPKSGLSVKLFGNHPWPTHNWLGTCSDEDARDLFVSATVCPNVSEPHSTDLNFDIIERVFKVPSAGGFLISDFVQETEDLFGKDVVPMAKTSSDFEDMVRHYVKYPEDRLPITRVLRKDVLTNHTYHCRVAQMLSMLGMDSESKRCLAMHSSMVGPELNRL